MLDPITPVPIHPMLVMGRILARAAGGNCDGAQSVGTLGTCSATAPSSSTPTPTGPSRHDLFTELAPAQYKDRVPRVEDGRRRADVGVRRPRRSGRASAGAVSSARDGQKESADLALNHWTIDDIHVGAYDPKVRLEVLDECGIDAQVIFPSTIGLGGQDLGMVDDEALCRLVDRDLQRPRWPRSRPTRATGCSPLPLMPAWRRRHVRRARPSASPRSVPAA